MEPQEQIKVLVKVADEGINVLAEASMALLQAQKIDDILDIVDERACIKEDLRLIAWTIERLERM